MSFLHSLVDNPLVHGIEHFGKSLWNMTDLAQQLRAAADQHQQMQQLARNRDLDMALRQQEFAQRQQQQDWQHQQGAFGNQMAVMANGGQPVAPGQESAVPAGPQDPVNPAMIGANPRDSRRIVTPPGGQQGYYMPSQDEQASSSLQHKLAETSALNKANEYELPDSLSGAFEQRLGVAPGSMKGFAMPKGAAPNFLSQFAKQPTEEKTAKLQPHYTSDDAGNVSAFAFDPEAGTVKPAGKFAGAGPRRKDPDAPRAEKPKQMTPTQANTIRNRFKSQLEAAEAAFTAAKEAATVGGYTDTEAEQKAAGELQRAKQSAQDRYESSLEEFGVDTSHVEYSPVVPGKGKGDAGTKGGQQQQPGPRAAQPAGAPAQQRQAAPPKPQTTRPRAKNPKTGAIVEYNGSAWVPITKQ